MQSSALCFVRLPIFPQEPSPAPRPFTELPHARRSSDLQLRASVPPSIHPQSSNRPQQQRHSKTSQQSGETLTVLAFVQHADADDTSGVSPLLAQDFESEDRDDEGDSWKVRSVRCAV